MFLVSFFLSLSIIFLKFFHVVACISSLFPFTAEKNSIVWIDHIYLGMLQFMMPQTVKNLPVMWETWFQSLGWECPLEQEMATHSSMLAWRISRDRGAWWITVHGVAKISTHSTAKVDGHLVISFAVINNGAMTIHVSFCMDVSF